jgi:hypothetical protein
MNRTLVSPGRTRLSSIALAQAWERSKQRKETSAALSLGWMKEVAPVERNKYGDTEVRLQRASCMSS